MISEKDALDLRNQILDLKKALRALQEENKMLRAKLEHGTNKHRTQSGQFTASDGMTKNEKCNTAYTMFKRGYSYDQIARQIGVSKSTAERYVYLKKQEYRARRGDFDPHRKYQTV